MDVTGFHGANLGSMNPRRLAAARDRPSLATRIREARVAKEMTQEALARATGVISTSVSRFERGVFKPDEDTLARIADALDVSVEWLRYGVEPRPHVESIDVVPPQFQEWLGLPKTKARNVTQQEIETLAGFRFPYGHPGPEWYSIALLALRDGTLGVPQ